MTIVVIFALTIALLGLYIFYYKTGVEIPKKSKNKSLVYMLLIGLLIRLISAYFYKGHETDMACFNGWSEMLKNGGLSSFYTTDAFTDYPPGYMYVLYLLGFVKDIFGTSSVFTYIVLKLPAIICDLLCGALIYRICEKYDRKNLKNLITSFYIFNPVIILNSAVWGQVDSVFTLFIVFMLYALTQRKMVPAYFSFAIAVLIKPQALFYAPVLLFGIVENIFLKDFSKEKLFKNIISGLSAVAFLFLLMLPFGLSNVLSQYINTIGSYNYASVNAYNLWTAVGKNWEPLSGSLSIFSYILMLLTVIVSAYIFFSKQKEGRYFTAAAFICFSVFVLSVKMHERYAFPVMMLLLCSYIFSANKKDMYFYLAISTLQFLNISHILFFYNPITAFEPEFNNFSMVISWITVIVFLIFVIDKLKGFSLNLNKGTNLTKTCKERNITKTDLICIFTITAIYASIALFNLGDTKAPQTFEALDKNSTLEISFEETEISKLSLYIGAEDIQESDMVTISLYNNGVVTHEEVLTEGNVFRWEEFHDVYAYADSVRITSLSPVYLGEIGIFSSTGEKVQPINSGLIADEQDTVPLTSNYRNSTYFDEIYHARTAYEFVNGLPVYEWTHPPLGKTLISLGINIFGMTPFGWRIIGTMFGIMMVPVLYIFSKKMFGTTWISALSAIVFSFDFMHFTQTRIATIDVYVTFFIMMMYLFMYKYCDEYSKSKSIAVTFLPLALSGFFMGLGIASKWTGVYAGVGLAVIFFLNIFFKRRNNEVSNKDIYKTIGFCLIIFVLVPLIIYALSYIPFLNSNNGEFGDIIKNQVDMFTYHGKTVVESEHQFSSKWYEWMVNYRPIWYYTGNNGSLTENISAFGNPLVWISGLFAFFYCVYDAIFYRNKNATFLIISYLAQLLPWVFVERTTFIYHYFPCVPFLVLMIAHFVHRMHSKYKYTKTVYISFAVLTVILFLVFYPSISGFPIDRNYVKEFLTWLPSWHLTN